MAPTDHPEMNCYLKPLNGSHGPWPGKVTGRDDGILPHGQFVR